MSDQNPPPPEPQQSSSSGGMFLLLFLVVAACAGGLVLFMNPSKKEAPLADSGMFDMQDLPEAKKTAPAPLAEAKDAQPASSLQMAGSLPEAAPDDAKPAAKQAAPSGARQAFVDAVRRAEGRMTALAEAYTKKYPVIERYGQEWMKHPELKKLNDDYMANHDAVEFMRGLAKSKEFPQMVKKYAHESVVQSFVMDAVKKAPGEVMKAATGYIKEDHLVKNLVNSVMSSLGLPPGLLGGAEGGQKVGQKEVVDSLMKSNPNMQQLMSTPEAQKVLQDQVKDKR